MLLNLGTLGSPALAKDGEFPGRLGREVRPGMREASLSLPDGAGAPAARAFSLQEPLINGSPGKLASGTKDRSQLLYDGFESGLSNAIWSHSYNLATPYWGDWTCWSSAGSRSAGCAVSGTGGITCGQNYPDGMQSWITTGPANLNIAGITGGVFQCDLNLVCEEPDPSYYDYFFMGVSLDGNNYQGYIYYGTESGTRILDLRNVPEFGNVLGQGQVYFAFMFYSDGSKTTPNGAQIDEVVIAVDVPSANQEPTVTLTAPNGGQTFAAGATTSITYTATDPDGGPQALSIALDYSIDSGGSWTNIATGQGNTGTYSWTVPAVPTSNARVRVRASDGAAEVADASDGNFSITLNSNALALGTASGASGSTVTVPLSLDNEDIVKGVQLDITLNGETAYLAGVVGSGRGAGMVAESTMVDANRARVILYHDTTAQIAAGTGEIAQLSFTLQGAGGFSSTLTPTDMVLSSPQGGALPVSGSNGQLTISAPTEVPVVQVVGLKNPGRTRMLQIMVHVANGSGSAPTVTAAGSNVAMTALGQGVYMGSYAAAATATSVSVSASDTNNQGTGSGQTTVSFP